MSTSRSASYPTAGVRFAFRSIGWATRNSLRPTRPTGTRLLRTTTYRVEPELQFEPEANASYDLAAKVTNAIVDSGVTRFGFVGNERYREFARN